MNRQGICKNVGVCTHANKVQIITDDETEFVCQECGEPLEPFVEEEPQKQKQSKPFIIAIIAVVLVVAGAVCAVYLKGRTAIDDADKEKARVNSIAQVEADRLREKARLDSIAAADEAACSAAEEQVKKMVSSGSVSYGEWSGGWENGKPHGMGTMTYNESHLIDSRDQKKRTAAAGDYIVGEFYEGKLVQGVWYDKYNREKGGIIIGR